MKDDHLHWRTIEKCVSHNCVAYAVATMSEFHDEFQRNGIEFDFALEHEGWLSVELKRGPCCKLEEAEWPKVFQRLSDFWYACTPPGYSHWIEVKCDDGYFDQFEGNSIDEGIF